MVILSVVLMRYSNLEIDSPTNLFPKWGLNDGPTGSWNSRFYTIGLVTASDVLITHCSFSDGAYPDEAEPVVFGRQIMRHDGMIDIPEGSDYVTVSYNKFINHDKMHLVGNNDGYRGRVTKAAFTLRFMETGGSVHCRDPLGFGLARSTSSTTYTKGKTLESTNCGITYIGMGINSIILCKNNVFEIDVTTSMAPEDLIVGDYKGYNLNNMGSTFNGTSIDLNEIATRNYNTVKTSEIAAAAAAGWTVADWATHKYTNVAFEQPYKYKLEKVKDMKKEVMKKAGQRLNDY